MCVSNAVLYNTFLLLTPSLRNIMLRYTEPEFVNLLKVPKREIFVTELIILSHPIWVGDLRTKAKNRFLSIVRLLSAILFFYR